MTLDAKTRFRNSPYAKEWGNITASDAFTEATSAALLDMLSRQANDSAAANHYRLEGARAFLGILTNLTSLIPEPKRDVAQNLQTNT